MFNFQISRKVLGFFTCSSGNFWPTVDERMFYIFVSKVQNEQGILLFLHILKILEEAGKQEI